MFRSQLFRRRLIQLGSLTSASVLVISLTLSGCGRNSATDLIQAARDNYNNAMSAVSYADKISRLEIAFDLATEAKAKWPDDSNTKSFFSSNGTSDLNFSTLETSLANTFNNYRYDCIRGPNIQCVYIVARHMAWSRHDEESATDRLTDLFSTKTKVQNATNYIKNLASGSLPDDDRSVHIENLVAIGRSDVAEKYWSKDKNLSTISFDNVMSCYSNSDSSCAMSFPDNDKKYLFFYILRKMFTQSGRPADFYKIAIKYYKDDVTYWLSDHLVRDFEEFDAIRSNLHSDDDRQTVINAFSLGSDIISSKNSKDSDALIPFIIKTAIENKPPEESMASIFEYMDNKKDTFNSGDSVYSGCRLISAIYGLEYAIKYEDYTGDKYLNGKRVCGSNQLLSSYPDKYDPDAEQKYRYAFSEPDEYLNMSSQNRQNETRSLLVTATKSIKAYIDHTIKWNVEMAGRTGIRLGNDLRFDITLYDIQDKIRFICRSTGDGSYILKFFKDFNNSFPNAKITGFSNLKNVDPIEYVCNRGIYDYYIDTGRFDDMNKKIKIDNVTPEQYIKANEMFMGFSRWSRFALSIEDTDTGLIALSSVLERFM